LGYPAIINAKFTPEIKGVSIIAAAHMSNILISYIQYASMGHTLLCGELN
jgi:hypothetical protein